MANNTIQTENLRLARVFSRISKRSGEPAYVRLHAHERAAVYFRKAGYSDSAAFHADHSKHPVLVAERSAEKKEGLRLRNELRKANAPMRAIIKVAGRYGVRAMR